MIKIRWKFPSIKLIDISFNSYIGLAMFVDYDNFISPYSLMLEFSNIELQANNKRFTKQARKLIRVSVSKINLK